MDVDGGDDAVLGVAPVDVGPEALLVGAVLVHALEAVLAGTALDPVVDEDAVACLEAEGIGACLDDLASHVEAEDAGEATGGTTGADAEVGEVDGGGADADEDLAGFGFRVGAVAVNHDLGAASLVDVDRFHGGPPWMGKLGKSGVAGRNGRLWYHTGHGYPGVFFQVGSFQVGALQVGALQVGGGCRRRVVAAGLWRGGCHACACRNGGAHVRRHA